MAQAPPTTSKTVRPSLPRERMPNAFAAPSVPLYIAASKTEVDEGDLLEAAEGGWLPPWVAWKPGIIPRGQVLDARNLWRFSPKITGAEITRHLSRRWLWLERIHPHDSDLTAAWAEDADTGHVDMAQIAEWCRCALPNGLNANSGMFAIWCADHPYGASMTAHRHATLSRWFRILHTEGVPDVADHSPATGTKIGVFTDV